LRPPLSGQSLIRLKLTLQETAANALVMGSTKTVARATAPVATITTLRREKRLRLSLMPVFSYVGMRDRQTFSI
jgi:hypothetical protein